MNKNLTDITLVVDRSGSMQDIREDAEGGINAFIEEQRKQPGETLLTLLQFDTEYELLHNGLPVADVPKYRLVPRGMTALLDAVGRAINETGDRLSKMAEADRPGLVVFVIMTDGMENSSREFTKQQVRQLIDQQQSAYSWQFTFLGADQDAFAEASGMGIQAEGAANFSKDKVGATFAAVQDKVSRMRGQMQAGETVCNAFTAEERSAMED
jgi:hypothetical protein